MIDTDDFRKASLRFAAGLPDAKRAALAIRELGDAFRQLQQASIFEVLERLSLQPGLEQP